MWAKRESLDESASMAVAVVTERMVLAGKERSLMVLLKQLQSKAALHPGYITSVRD